MFICNATTTKENVEYNTGTLSFDVYLTTYKDELKYEQKKINMSQFYLFSLVSQYFTTIML